LSSFEILREDRLSLFWIKIASFEFLDTMGESFELVGGPKGGSFSKRYASNFKNGLSYHTGEPHQ